MKRRAFVTRQLSLALFTDAKLDLGHKRGRAKSARRRSFAAVLATFTHTPKLPLS